MNNDPETNQINQINKVNKVKQILTNIRNFTPLTQHEIDVIRLASIEDKLDIIETMNMMITTLIEYIIDVN